MPIGNWANCHKRRTQIISVNKCARNLAINDPTKQSFSHTLIIDDLVTLLCLVRLLCGETANSYVSKCNYVATAMLFADIFVVVI